MPLNNPTPDSIAGREALVSAITTFLAGQDAQSLAGIRDALVHEIDKAGPRALFRLDRRLQRAGADWGYYHRDPLARRIHHLLADRLLRQASVLEGAEHLSRLAGQPVVIVANHLSYSDANLIEVLLRRGGAAELADRLTVIAGPKVYSSLQRRFSSLCFGTIKTPQSSGLSSDEAVMNRREVARAAHRSIEIAHERLRLGEALLIFGEGTRSRSGRMQRLLPGVARYLGSEGVWILPAAVAGTDAMFPIGEAGLNPVPCVVRLGKPVAAGALRERCADDRRLMMDVLGLLIAALLPAPYRGVYGLNVAARDEDEADLADARGLLDGLFD
jgi:1-acyl-sn-glycerol-3-phosphate acyltransferase